MEYPILTREEATIGWSNEYVKALVIETVNGNNISDKFKSSKIENIDDLLDILFEDEESTVFELFKNKDNLLNNLIAQQMFPNPFLYFGCKINFEHRSISYLSSKNTMFFTKHEALGSFYAMKFKGKMSFLMKLVNTSVIRKIGRHLNETNQSNDMIPKQIFDKQMKDLIESYGRTAYIFDVIDLKFENFITIFDSKYDDDLISQVNTLLHLENEMLPLSANKYEYTNLYMSLVSWKNCVENFFNTADWFHKKYEVLRGFFENEKRCDSRTFFIAKEAENVLDIVMKKKYSKPFPKGLISIENEEEHDDVHLISIPIQVSKFRCSHPISTPYGTYCKLAFYAFRNFFDEVAYGLNLFRKGGLKKKNLPDSESVLTAVGEKISPASTRAGRRPSISRIFLARPRQFSLLASACRCFCSS
ncbi:unnamed protein product [Caenorhabditis angaria]|uniref:Uncharacterized protein n=1 Tax=Caenorhabditis angaria TaxID=860376 RepID=A0A9P1I7P4_9PELO|nr:unnamed protein product [Caenorhabditis angaria]